MRTDWAAWRLVYSDGGLDYNTVFHQMTPEEIEMANIALDMVLQAQKKRQSR